MSSLLLSASPSIDHFHQHAIVVDTHVDTVLRMMDKNAHLKDWSPAQVDIPKMRKGGLDVVFFSIWVDPAYGPKSKARAIELITRLNQEISANPNDIELAKTRADVDRILKAGKIVALYGMEGTHPLLGSLENLELFHTLGVRYMGLTWSVETPFAGSSGTQARDYGLTAQGKALVTRAQELGMMIDLSHASDQSFNDVMALSRLPVIASHSSSRQLRNHPRNLTDAQLKTLADNGGVVGVNFYPGFLTTRTQARLQDVVAHIEHMVAVAGEDHVGLGSDFDGIRRRPLGLQDASQYPNLTKALLKRGHSKARVRKILGGNFLRVMRATLPAK